MTSYLSRALTYRLSVIVLMSFFTIIAGLRHDAAAAVGPTSLKPGIIAFDSELAVAAGAADNTARDFGRGCSAWLQYDLGGALELSDSPTMFGKNGQSDIDVLRLENGAPDLTIPVGKLQASDVASKLGIRYYVTSQFVVSAVPYQLTYKLMDLKTGNQVDDKSLTGTMTELATQLPDVAKKFAATIGCTFPTSKAPSEDDLELIGRVRWLASPFDRPLPTDDDSNRIPVESDILSDPSAHDALAAALYLEKTGISFAADQDETNIMAQVTSDAAAGNANAIYAVSLFAPVNASVADHSANNLMCQQAQFWIARANPHPDPGGNFENICKEELAAAKQVADQAPSNPVGSLLEALAYSDRAESYRQSRTDVELTIAEKKQLSIVYSEQIAAAQDAEKLDGNRADAWRLESMGLQNEDWSDNDRSWHSNFAKAEQAFWKAQPFTAIELSSWMSPAFQAGTTQLDQVFAKGHPFSRGNVDWYLWGVKLFNDTWVTPDERTRHSDVIIPEVRERQKDYKLLDTLLNRDNAISISDRYRIWDAIEPNVPEHWNQAPESPDAPTWANSAQAAKNVTAVDVEHRATLQYTDAASSLNFESLGIYANVELHQHPQMVANIQTGWFVRMINMDHTRPEGYIGMAMADEIAIDATTGRTEDWLAKNLVAEYDVKEAALTSDQATGQAKHIDSMNTNAQLATKYAPHSFEAFRLLGLAKYELGDYNASIQAYEKALSFSPQQIGLYLGLANAQMKNNLLDESIETMRKATRTNSELVAYTTLAALCLKRGQWKNAVDAANGAYRFDHNNVDVLTILARAHYELAAYDESILDCNAILYLTPAGVNGEAPIENGEAHVILSEDYTMQKKPRLPHIELESALRFAKAPIVRVKNAVKAKSGNSSLNPADYYNSIRDCNAILFDPDLKGKDTSEPIESAHLIRGEDYFEIGQRDAATIEWKEAAKCDSTEAKDVAEGIVKEATGLIADPSELDLSKVATTSSAPALSTVPPPK